MVYLYSKCTDCRINKINYIEMREREGQSSQRLLSATEIVWRVGWDEIFNLLQRLPCACSFSKSTKGFFCVCGVWHSPNMLPTMIWSTVRVSVLQPDKGEYSHLFATQRRTEQLCGFESWESSSMPIKLVDENPTTIRLRT